MRKKAYEALEEQLGKVQTLLDRELISSLASGLIAADWEEKEEWATYAQVFIELKQTGAMNHYKKFAYYFTENRNKARVLLILMDGLKYKSDELIRLEGKLRSYQF